MRPNGQALLGSRGIFETKPHRKAFPHSHRCKQRLPCNGRSTGPGKDTCQVDRNEGQTKPESQAAPTQRTVDQCLSHPTRELVTII